MSEQQSPPFRRRRQGKVLRQLRESARLSPQEVCDKLEISAARLSRLENGQTAPDVLVVKSLLDVYGVPVNDWEPYLEMAREAKKKGWWQAHGLPAMGYIGLEAAANSVRDFALAHVPGLLQTEAYTRAVLNEALVSRTTREYENEVTVRAIRQRRLTDSHDPLSVTTDADDGDIAYVAHVAGSLQLEKAEQVRAAKLVFDQLRTEALAPEESVALLGRLANEF